MEHHRRVTGLVTTLSATFFVGVRNLAPVVQLSGLESSFVHKPLVESPISKASDGVVKQIRLFAVVCS